MARLSIKLRILLLAAVPTVLLGVVLIVISVMSANDISQTSVEQQREALYQQKRQELDRLLEMAITAGKKASNQDQLKDILRTCVMTMARIISLSITRMVYRSSVRTTRAEKVKITTIAALRKDVTWYASILMRLSREAATWNTTGLRLAPRWPALN
jgi:hypothetical protein